MRRLQKNLGLTLSELLVASILISIVMVGVAAFSSTFTGAQGATSRKTLAEITTTAELTQIRRDAALAIGDASSPGVWFDKAVNRGYLCFRHETNGNPSSYTHDLAGNPDPDTWVCYTHGGSYHIYRCEGNVDPAAVGHCASQPKYTFFGGIPANGTGSFFEVVYKPDGALDYIELSFLTRTDKYAGVTCDDPINNPCAEQKTRVSPSGYSRK